jgi:hypothetical protein
MTLNKWNDTKQFGFEGQAACTLEQIKNKTKNKNRPELEQEHPATLQDAVHLTEGTSKSKAISNTRCLPCPRRHAARRLERSCAGTPAAAEAFLLTSLTHIRPAAEREARLLAHYQASTCGQVHFCVQCC